MTKNLFDDMPEHTGPPLNPSGKAVSEINKEDTLLDRLKNLEEKIANAISKVRELKEEKTVLERRVRELEELLDERNREIDRLSSEKVTVKNQVEELLHELDALNIE